MIQDVNLYTSLFQENVGSPSAIQIVRVGCAAIGLAILFCIYSVFTTGVHEDELNNLLLTQQDKRQEVAELRQKYGVKKTDDLISSEVEQLKRQVESKTILLGSLVSRSGGTKTGFSHHVEGLARQRIRGLWLTGIDISNGGREISLQGFSLRPEYVPKLIQLLRQEPAFRGQQFSSFTMTRKDRKSNDIRFELTSRPADKTKIP